MSQKIVSDELKIRIKEIFIGSRITAADLQKHILDQFGIEVNFETISWWIKDGGWYEERKVAKVYCPHCSGDITDFLPNNSEIGDMYEHLIMRLYDDITTGKELDSQMINSWRQLVKESGWRPDLGAKGSARSDLDQVLRRNKETNGDLRQSE